MTGCCLMKLHIALFITYYIRMYHRSLFEYVSHRIYSDVLSSDLIKYIV